MIHSLMKEPKPVFATPSETPNARVYILVLNWNGWRDTIECLESVFRLDYPDYEVIVCDNGSSDGSLEQIRRWARGEIEVEARNPALAGLTSPPIPKPIPLAEVGGGKDCASNGEDVPRLLLMQTGSNLGFAGGNNVALRYVLKLGDFDFVWLLNNDTVVRPDALSQLVQRMAARPDAGICGSTLLYYHDPSKVQAWGGSIFNHWVARGGHLGNLASAMPLPEASEVERKMAYVEGASMLVRREFLEQIGLMDEGYFLTGEEIDWATRARGRFTLAYAPGSIVYHREGGATGSHRDPSLRNSVNEFYCIRTRVLFTRKHHPLALFSVLCAIGASTLYRLLNRRWKHASAVIRGAAVGLTAAKLSSNSHEVRHIP
jgi:GT2 family glycosyltransferase